MFNESSYMQLSGFSPKYSTYILMSGMMLFQDVLKDSQNITAYTVKRNTAHCYTSVQL